MSESEGESLPARLAAAVARLLVTAWVGGMWIIGYIVTPTLFASLDDRILAGHIAGRLFSAIACIGFVAAAYLLGFMAVRQKRAVLRNALFWVVVAMLVCVAAGSILQMEMAALKAGLESMDVMESAQRGRFAMLHGVSSVIYLVQSVLGVWVVSSGVFMRPYPPPTQCTQDSLHSID
ncbi:MAG: DUF4149 domain-containing protein [Betaproteobacteria bacterium]|nr:DUF4149 domain-containing protein [Betaproteobacteria bacterium]